MIFLPKIKKSVRGERNMLEKTDFHKYLYLNCWWTLPAVIFINVLIIYAIHFMNSWKYIGATTFYKQEREFCSQLQMYFLSARETGAITFHVIFKNICVMEQLSWAHTKTDVAIPRVAFHSRPPGFFKIYWSTQWIEKWGSKFLYEHFKFWHMLKISCPRTSSLFPITPLEWGKFYISGPHQGWGGGKSSWSEQNQKPQS